MPDDTDRTVTKLSGFGVDLQLPLPPWGTMTIVALLALTVIIWRVWGNHSVFDLLTDAEKRKQQEWEYAEYNKHLGEMPEPCSMVEDPKAAQVSRYRSDQCTLIRQQVKGRWRSRIVRPLADDPDDVPTTAPPTPAASGGVVSYLMPTVFAQGSCLNPHPGAFNSWFGPQEGGWVPVWRQWPDGSPGCTHWQWFDPAHGVWDTNADGSPNVHWTRCLH